MNLNELNQAADEIKASDGIEDEDEEYQPFDPEKISIDTKGITMDTCLRRLEQGTIILNPDFQRAEVWTSEKKCRLIESLMLKIPLPMFYVSADEKGYFYVVDGLQRLSTIRSFVLGDKYLSTKNIADKGQGFKLSELEFWGDFYNGKAFADLPVYIQNRILETGFTFTIINPGTPEEVKRNIFKRINTGGEPLTPQEIRHALYIGDSTVLLQRLSELSEFTMATGGSVKTNRMMDRELILRFLAFTVRSYKSYPKNSDMDAFLSDTMRIINVLNDLNGKDSERVFKKDGAILRDDIVIDNVAELERLFKLAMVRSEIMFGEHTFRKSWPPFYRAPINKSLFEVWSTLLSRLTPEEFDKLKTHKADFLESYKKVISTGNFEYSISRNSLKIVSVNDRYEKFTELLNQYTK